MFRAFFAATVVHLALATFPVVAQPSSEQCVDSAAARADVLSLDTRRIEALLRNDVEALDSITAEDYSHVESSGGARNKAEFLAGRRNGRSHFSTFVIEENEVTIYCNVAVVIGRYHNSVRGSPTVKRARHLRVYVHRNGEWRNVAHQATEIGRLPR